MVHATGLMLDGVLLTSLPFLAGVVCNLAGGILGDRLTQRIGTRTALRLIPSVCLAGTALVLTAMALSHSRLAIVLLSSAGFGMMDLMLPSAWAMCVSIGGRFSGTATGVMNTAGQAGGFLGTVFFGYVVQASGSYNLPVCFIAAMVLISALLFARVDCTQRLDAEVCEPTAQPA